MNSLIPSPTPRPSIGSRFGAKNRIRMIRTTMPSARGLWNMPEPLRSGNRRLAGRLIARLLQAQRRIEPARPDASAAAQAMVCSSRLQTVDTVATRLHDASITTKIAAVRRIVLPSGRAIEVVRFCETHKQVRQLHICPLCESDLVQPVAWSAQPEARWHLRSSARTAVGPGRASTSARRSRAWRIVSTKVCAR